jgi:raffinose/stachyose/melibiose transport system permease protein
MAQFTAARLSPATRKPILTEQRITAILFLIPALIIFLVFVVWPIFMSFRYSLVKWDGLAPLSEAPYVELQNYQRLLDDPIFWKATGNNIFVVAWSLITQIPIAMALAILLTGKIKGSAFFRTLYFAPLILSDVLASAIWGWFFNPTIGLANSFLRSIGATPSAWLGDTNIALICVMMVATWKYLGFYVVIYIAAIQGIPEELYEAAQIDGANGWQLHRFITIPLLGTTSRTNAVLIIVGSLKFFDLVWALTQGGPSNSSELLATYMFKQAFSFKDWSYGSTIAFALFFIAFASALFFTFLTRKRERA